LETFISEINAPNLQIKLSSEKLYIKTAIKSETFALQSINEIRIIDLVDEFNLTLAKHLKKRSSAFGIMATGITLLSVGIVLKIWWLSIWGILPLIIGNILLKKLDDPTLKSSLRLVMSNGSRNFEFDKFDYGSAKVEEFVFNVESTLRNIHRQGKDVFK